MTNAEAVGEVVEVGNGQDESEVRYGHVVAVDRVVDALGAGRGEVGDELVAAQVPVDPGVGAAALLKAENLAVEAACFGQVVDWYGQVEAGDLGIGGGHGVDVLPVRGWFLGGGLSRC
jgi:hypothetical protein